MLTLRYPETSKTEGLPQQIVNKFDWRYPEDLCYFTIPYVPQGLLLSFSFLVRAK
jgi:hypothetical protein